MRSVLVAKVSAVVSDLRVRLTQVIDDGIRHGVSAPGTADAVLMLLETERAVRCRDNDCARILSHNRLSAHLWRHEAQPPFDHVLFRWLCFTCGLRRGHRIHRAVRP